MKNLLTIAIILASANAFATRARVMALGSSAHLSDTQTVFGNPADMTGYKDSLSLESGKSNLTYTNTAATAMDSSGAEGLLIRSMGDAKLGFALGHDNTMVYLHRSMMDTNTTTATVDNSTVLTQQNPFAIMYAGKSGDMSWGVGLEYSNHNNKTVGAEAKESSMGLNLGARTGSWDASINALLGNTWESGTTTGTKLEFKGSSGFSISGGYNVSNDMYVYGNVTSGGFKSTSTTAGVSTDGVAYDQMDYKLGVVSTVKQDANEFFYGVALASTSLKQKTTGLTGAAAQKTTTMGLPFIIGLEADAASWLTLRGSVTQNVLIHDNKTSPDAGNPTVDQSPSTNNTTYTAGAGLKLNAVTLDGTILTGATQTINSGNLLAQVGLTYNF